MQPRPWHPEVRRLWSLGWSMIKIGQRVGVHRNTVLRVLNPEMYERERQRRRGQAVPKPRVIPTPKKSRKPTEPWHHEAKALMAEIGPRYAEIGRRVGKGKDAVRRFLDYRANERYLEKHHARYVRDQQYREKRQAQARAWHARQRAARSAPPPP